MAKVRFTLYFLIGAYFSLHRRHITYRPLIAGILLVVLGLSVLTPHPPVAGVVCIPYLVLYAAQIRIPLLNNFGRAGDFSYGMYVYHYPIQQALIQISGEHPLPPGALRALVPARAPPGVPLLAHDREMGAGGKEPGS